LLSCLSNGSSKNGIVRDFIELPVASVQAQLGRAGRK
jgi:hypothetical protein